MSLQDVINWALNQRGKPYVYGAAGPDAFDCSGLVEQAFKAAGITLPRTSQEMRNSGVGVPLSQVQPGDVVTFTYPNGGSNPGPGNHVALYYGSGQVIEAARPGTTVRVAPLDVAHVDRVRRITGGGASTSPGGAVPVAASTSTGVQTAALQQAGYDAVIHLTPWGIPLNPFKLPGWIGGQLGKLGGDVGGAAGGFAWDTLGPIVLATVGVVGGVGLVVLGLYVTAKPAIDSGLDTVGKVNAVA